MIGNFYDSILQNKTLAPTVAQIVSASDAACRKEINTIPEPDNTVNFPAPQLLVEIEHLKEENECMKLHLSEELGKLRAENEQLHRRLREKESRDTDNTPQSNYLHHHPPSVTQFPSSNNQPPIPVHLASHTCPTSPSNRHQSGGQPLSASPSQLQLSLSTSEHLSTTLSSNPSVFHQSLPVTTSCSQLQPPSSSSHQLLATSSSNQPASSLSTIPPINNQPSNSSTTSSNIPWELEDGVIKTFNSLPKDITAFYQQMKEGDDKLPKFENLPQAFKKNKSTKGAYSKRKAIYMFIDQHEGLEHVHDFLDKHKELSPLQLYDRYIKKSRPHS